MFEEQAGFGELNKKDTSQGCDTATCLMPHQPCCCKGPRTVPMGGGFRKDTVRRSYWEWGEDSLDVQSCLHACPATQYCSLPSPQGRLKSGSRGGYIL